MRPPKFILLLVATIALLAGPNVTAKDYWAYFGTFTNETCRGVYVSRFDPKTGRLSPAQVAAEIPSPTFLAVSPDGGLLFTATRAETFDGRKGGSVSAFAIDRHTGSLRLLDQKFSGGEAPCHVSVDRDGQNVFVANYLGGSVKSFHLNRDGTLAEGTSVLHHGSSVNTNRQSHAYAHCMAPAPAGRFVLACDLGTDKVTVYQVDSTNAALTAVETASVPPGSGARHLAFGPDGHFAYVINEMGCSVTAFAWDGIKGTLTPHETVSLLPPDAPVTNTFTAAEIAVSPDGRFVYGTTRGHDSISVLAVGAKTGALSLVQNLPSGGNAPRGMGIDPSGRWLLAAHQKSGTVTVFAIAPATGKLTPTGQALPAGSPVDVKFVESQ
jgi:6-phosphogluconolactonase